MPRRNRKSKPKTAGGRTPDKNTPDRFFLAEEPKSQNRKSANAQSMWGKNEDRRKQDEERRRKIEEERKREEERRREAQRQADERRRQEEERRRIEDEKRREEMRRVEEQRKREREAAEEFRRHEQKRLSEVQAQKHKNEALLAARRKIEEARVARAREQERQKEQLERDLREKEEREKEIRKQNEQRMLEEMSQREASLLAEEARLAELQETDALRREMESRSSSRLTSAPSSGRQPQSRKRGRVVDNSEFDEFVKRVFAEIPQDPALPHVGLVKIPNKSGVFRFGTRNVVLLASDDGSQVLVRQGVNNVLFVDFVEKYLRTEGMKLKGMACLNGFMGAGYV